MMRYILAAVIAVSSCFIGIEAKADLPKDIDQPSLFFSRDEMEKIYNAVDGIVDTTKPADSNSTRVEGKPVDPGPRVLKLAGVLYHGERDWVIWFNGERVTPKNKPEHMMDVLVREDKVAIKWFDVGTNRIINLVLRPHQEYHIDTDTISIGTER